MSISLLPGIALLKPGSLTDSIYRHLYGSFFNAQDKKDAEHPYGITEGDETSIRLHNMAYNFAGAIAAGLNWEGGENAAGISLEYLRKSGGDMSGMFRANNGFEAGCDQIKLLEAFRENILPEGNAAAEAGIKVHGSIRINGGYLTVNGEKILDYDTTGKKAFITSPYIDFSSSQLLSKGSILLGENKASGIYISPALLQVNGNNVYHEGNANKGTTDWQMYHARVEGSLSVENVADFKGLLHACNGFELGVKDRVILDINAEGTVNINNHLSFSSGHGIMIESIPVLIRVNQNDIQLGGLGGDLIIGNDSTNKIRLYAGLSDIDGSHILLSRYGAAYFPDSLTVRHNYGETLLSSYRADEADEGMVIHKKLRFTDSNGAFFTGNPVGIVFSSTLVRFWGEDNQRLACTHKTLFSHTPSVSSFIPFDRLSNSFSIQTDADFFHVNRPVEAEGHIGISNSFTRLADGGLFFTSESYLLSTTGGIKHYGNAFFLNSLSSEKFSSGFAGSGWAIMHNKTTGNMAATFDELTVRKKMRIYELEVQKISATNGSLWVSDSCSGDAVFKL